VTRIASIGQLSYPAIFSVTHRCLHKARLGPLLITCLPLAVHAQGPITPHAEARTMAASPRWPMNPRTESRRLMPSRHTAGGLHDPHLERIKGTADTLDRILSPLR
jgi:hypothetical protein